MHFLFLARTDHLFKCVWFDLNSGNEMRRKYKYSKKSYQTRTRKTGFFPPLVFFLFPFANLENTTHSYKHSNDTRVTKTQSCKLHSSVFLFFFLFFLNKYIYRLMCVFCIILGYSKTVGEIQRAVVTVCLSLPLLSHIHIQKDGGKKAFSVSCFSATRTPPQWDTVFPYFYLAVRQLLLGLGKKITDYINIKYPKNSDRPTSNAFRVFSKKAWF